jgi:hypothetical protein
MMARLATLIADNEFFIPLPEKIMVDPKNREKPGLFLTLFPHSLSRLMLTLLWKINGEQDGDAVVLSNTWLRGFARLDAKSLRKYRDHLHDHHVIQHKSIGSGREHLYRIVNRRGRPLADETDDDAVTRLKGTETQGQAIRKGVIKRYMRRSAARRAKAASAKICRLDVLPELKVVSGTRNPDRSQAL